jgi:hypothetical protein
MSDQNFIKEDIIYSIECIFKRIDDFKDIDTINDVLDIYVKINKYLLSIIIDENYKSIVSRELINKDTNFDDFLKKFDEELGEFNQAIKLKNIKNIKEELIDIILVGFNCAKHIKIDVVTELFNKISINYIRALNEKI